MIRLTPLVAIAALVLLPLGCGGGGGGDDTLAGRAEDLWGNAIDLSDYGKGVTFLHPFSPATCGYCLFDGDFTRVNYCDNAVERGGAFFGLCLFSPQIDIYAYGKHYRESFPVVTSPPDLHRYHRDGFPWITAFKNGEMVYSGGTAPYEAVYDSLRAMLWGEDVPLTPTSSCQMATNFVWENHRNAAVIVLADGSRIPESPANDSNVMKHESDLTRDDLGKSLLINGPWGELKLDFLRETEIPVEITDDKFAIGDYEFPKSHTGLAACFPNPHNPGQYVLLKAHGDSLAGAAYENWVDYCVYNDGPDGGPRVLMEGLFERDGRDWRFSRKRAWISPETMSFCKGGKCPAPFEAEPGSAKPPYSAPTPSRSATEHGELCTLGGSKCRFPALCADGLGGCDVVWEENGDVVLAKLGTGPEAREPEVIPIEEGRWDSFNPLVAVCGADTWVFYLNDRDGFYRLYGAYARAGGSFNEVLLSGEGAMDSFSPAVVSAGDSMAVAWTEWKANYRYLMYRTIEGRTLGETRQAAIKKSDIDYTNAWYASLAFDAAGELWGAWNQHYPLTLGVAAGDLVHEAGNVSEEFGGYPSVAVGPSGAHWVFWESFMNDILRDKPHRILAASCEAPGGPWSLPDDLSSGAGCVFNHAPKAAVDGDGVIWVAWSGRRDVDSPWGIYLVRSDGGGWSPPVLVSAEGEAARAPAVCAADGGGVWLAWHSGTGSDMKIKALRYGAR